MSTAAFPDLKRLRVVLAEDHETVREGLTALLAQRPQIEVVDQVGDADSAVERVRELQPDLLILDLSLPNGGGHATIRRIAEERGSTAIVVLTRFREPSLAREAMAAGAVGYVLKQSPFTELERAIEHATRGERYVDQQIAADVAMPARRGALAVSPREGEVLRLAARGEGNKDIAAALGISVKTVEVHKTQGMRKLGLRDRSGLVRYANLHGWLAEP